MNLRISLLMMTSPVFAIAFLSRAFSLLFEKIATSGNCRHGNRDGCGCQGAWASRPLLHRISVGETPTLLDQTVKLCRSSNL